MTLIMLIFYAALHISIEEANDNGRIFLNELGFDKKDVNTYFQDYLNVCIDEKVEFDKLETHSILGIVAFVFFTTFTMCLICSNCLKRCLPLFCCFLWGCWYFFTQDNG